MAEQDDHSEKKTRHRSPSYPTIGLRESVERLDKLYVADGKAGAPPEIAVKHMGFATAHGQAMSALSALKKFGLVNESNGRIVPSQRGIEIIRLPQDNPRRLQALKEAAVAPPIYRELMDQHKDTGLPGEGVLESELETYKNFNPNAVKGFVKDFKDTLEYAGLSDFSALESKHEEEETGESPFSIGDFVQWESDGVLRLLEPKRVRGFSEDLHWAFLDGSETGVPVSQLISADAPVPAQRDSVPAAPPRFPLTL